MQIINPIIHPNWDNIVSNYPGACIFHTSAWARVLYESYGYEPVYFVEENGNIPGSIIPIMEVKSSLTGVRGVSLPFTDFCDPLCTDDGRIEATYKGIIRYGRLKRWKYVEFRGNVDWKEGPVSSATYLVHVLPLSGTEKDVFKNFRSSTRRSVKKAQKEKVMIKIRHDSDAMNAYYRLHTITRKRQGLPPQPRKFFSKIQEHIISDNKGFIALATHGSDVVAGAIYFYFGKNAIYKYGASDMAYQHLRANNLVMWEAIRWFVDNGYEYLHFGRTAGENKGLIQFKRGWGTEESLLKYHKFDFKRSKFVNKNSGTEKSCSLFRYMPDYFCQLAGSMLYRHFG